MDTATGVCRNCGNDFVVKPYTKGRFCSRECYWQGKEALRPLDARLWGKVERIADGDGCWLWTGTRNNKGYGRIGLGPRQGTALAHRVAWELTFGPIPDSMFVCHTCDTPACIRPSHLFLGTNADNAADMVAKGRQATGERTQAKHPVVGSLHPKAKLTELQVTQIRQWYAGGRYGMAELAEQFGISLAMVHKLVHRKAWRHVP